MSAPQAPPAPPTTIFHVLHAADLAWDADDCYHAKSLATEGFLHASYREKVVESARLYFPADADLRVMEIDPMGLDVRVAQTPRGPMPHVYGALPRRHVVRSVTLDAL